MKRVLLTADERADIPDIEGIQDGAEQSIARIAGLLGAPDTGTADGNPYGAGLPLAPGTDWNGVPDAAAAVLCSGQHPALTFDTGSAMSVTVKGPAGGQPGLRLLLGGGTLADEVWSLGADVVLTNFCPADGETRILWAKIATSDGTIPTPVASDTDDRVFFVAGDSGEIVEIPSGTQFALVGGNSWTAPQAIILATGDAESETPTNTRLTPSVDFQWTYGDAGHAADIAAKVAAGYQKVALLTRSGSAVSYQLVGCLPVRLGSSGGPYMSITAALAGIVAQLVALSGTVWPNPPPISIGALNLATTILQGAVTNIQDAQAVDEANIATLQDTALTLGRNLTAVIQPPNCIVRRAASWPVPNDGTPIPWDTGVHASPLMWPLTDAGYVKIADPTSYGYGLPDAYAQRAWEVSGAIVLNLTRPNDPLVIPEDGKITVTVADKANSGQVLEEYWIPVGQLSVPGDGPTFKLRFHGLVLSPPYSEFVGVRVWFSGGIATATVAGADFWVREVARLMPL